MEENRFDLTGASEGLQWLYETYGSDKASSVEEYFYFAEKIAEVMRKAQDNSNTPDMIRMQIALAMDMAGV